MLQPILTTVVTDARLQPDAIAFCRDTGANLIRSRAQYVLIVPTGNTEEFRYWSRRKVSTDEDAIGRANKSLAKIVSQTQLQAYRHTFDQQHFFYYHYICVQRNPPDPEVTFEQIPLSDVPQEAECDFCYRPVHGPSAYYTTDQEVQA